jgi:hypothetical protein
MFTTGTAADIARYLTGNMLPRFEATTPHLSVLNPMCIESGLIDENTGEKIHGIPWGTLKYHGVGEVFEFDEFELYRRKKIQSMNVGMLGAVGKWKSGAMKTFLHRAYFFGYNAIILDPKEEYDSLRDMVPGSKMLRFGKGSEYFLNPLDDDIDESAQLDILNSILLTAMGLDQHMQKLEVAQMRILEEGIRAAKKERRVALLTDLADVLHDPSPELLKALHRTPNVFRDDAKNLVDGLGRLTRGALAGMVNQATSEGLFSNTPLLIISCKGLTREQSAMVIGIFGGLVSGHVDTGKLNHFHRIIVDEAWDLTEFAAFVNTLRRLAKLGGSQGHSVWFIIHHLDNLIRSGGHQAIEDLLPDTGTIFAFNEDPSELEKTASQLRLNEADVAKNALLDPGEFQAKIGKNRTLVVKNKAWEEELQMVQTRHLVHGEEKTSGTLRAVG